MKLFNFALLLSNSLLHDTLALTGLQLLYVIPCPLLQKIYLAAHVPHLQETVFIMLQLRLQGNKCDQDTNNITEVLYLSSKQIGRQDFPG